MNDFLYHNPVRVHFGKNALAALPDELAQVGDKVLLVSGGGSVRRTGLYDHILAALYAAGKEVWELSGVMPNPRTEKVYEGIEICREHGVEFILAVGGGSVIDCSKAIAVGARTEKDFWQAFFIDSEPAEDAIPLGVVLTIPATGSEMDKSAVITNRATGQKNSYDSALTYPRFSILDPTISFSLPREQMVNGIVDTMSHIFELYFSPPDGENVTDYLAEGLMRAIIRAARTAVKEPENYEARSTLMWGSSFALCGMLNNGKKTDWASHCIEHPLSAVYDVAHGAGLAVVHPAYLRYTCHLAPERFARFAREVWGIDGANKSVADLGLEGVQCVRNFFTELGAPSTLTELGISHPDLDRLVELTDLSCYGYKPLTKEDVYAILRMVL